MLRRCPRHSGSRCRSPLSADTPGGRSRVSALLRWTADVLKSGSGEAAYRQCRGSHHHHLVCRSCGRTVEVRGPAVENWADRMAAQHDYTDVSHTLELFGTGRDLPTAPLEHLLSPRQHAWHTGVVRVLAVALTLFLLLGCDGSTEDAESAAPTPTAASETTSRPTETEHTDPPEQTDATSLPDPDPVPVRFSTANAKRTVEFLAGRIGPREATSASYARAARWVAGRLRAYGYRVQRQVLHVPAGVSWGVPVPAGRTWNVVAVQAGVHLDEPHLMVGAQLDTVPQAPGAEDNASGVSVMLEVARLASQRPTRLPVAFVAFAAEEPRGDGEAWHHYGSRAYVQRMSPTEMSAMRGLANPDRIGVGRSVPVCTGGLGPVRVKRSLLEIARRLDIPATDCVNTTSDHWSFEQAGMRAARLGGTDYPQYHSPADLPRVVRPIQLRRAGNLIWQWLRTGR